MWENTKQNPRGSIAAAGLFIMFLVGLSYYGVPTGA